MNRSIKLNNIKERIWRLHDDSDFTRTLYIDSGWLAEHIDINEYQTGHAIYIESEKPEILFGFIHKTTDFDVGYFNTFLDYIKKFELTYFMDIVFAIDTYTLTNLFGKNRVLDLKFKNHSIIDSILKESQGAIIWHHQLENLYLFHRNDKNEATELRKNILKKRASTFELASKIKVDQNTTLNDVINNRMVLGGTIVPSMKEGNKIYQLVNYDQDAK